jgi:hypothetical protein
MQQIFLIGKSEQSWARAFFLVFALALSRSLGKLSILALSRSFLALNLVLLLSRSLIFVLLDFLCSSIFCAPQFFALLDFFFFFGLLNFSRSYIVAS